MQMRKVAGWACLWAGMVLSAGVAHGQAVTVAGTGAGNKAPGKQEGELLTRVWRSSYGGGVRSGPLTARDGFVYVCLGNADVRVRKINAETGKEAWATPVVADASRAGVASNGEVAIYTTDEDKSRIIGLDDKTGESRWTVTAGAKAQSEGCFLEGLYVAATDDGEVYGIEWATGKIRWQVKPGGVVKARPVVFDKRMIVAVTEAGHVWGLDPATGKTVESIELGMKVRGNPAIFQSSLLVGVTENRPRAKGQNPTEIESVISVSMHEKKIVAQWSGDGGLSDEIPVDESRAYVVDGERVIAITPYAQNVEWEYTPKTGRGAYPIFLKDRLVFGVLSGIEPGVSVIGRQNGVLMESRASGAMTLLAEPNQICVCGDMVVMFNRYEMEGRKIAPSGVGEAVATANPAWSEEVQGLKARTELRLVEVSHGTRVIAMDLVLTNSNNHYLRFDYPRAWLKTQVMDEKGNLLKGPSAGAFSGFVTEPEVIVIPGKSELKFEISVWGWGLSPDSGGMLVTNTEAWQIPKDGKDYYVRVALGVSDVSGSPFGHEIDGKKAWNGRLELPVVKVPMKGSAMSPEEVTRLIDKYGPELVKGQGARAEEAMRVLSFIDDPRLTAIYVKAMDVNNYQMRFTALERLSRIPGDEALKGIQKGMNLRDGIGSDNLRHSTAVALARSPHPDAKKLLLTMRNDSYLGVRLTVIQTLVVKGNPIARELGESMLNDSDDMVRGEARRLLDEAGYGGTGAKTK